MSRPPDLLPRALRAAIDRSVSAMPAVVVTGARQTGKSTLVRDLIPAAESRLYLTLDDLEVRDLARRDPEALLGRAPRMTLDEVQHEPDLLSAVKRTIDNRREPGRFILTGSANLLLMERVSESLAGRAVYLTLWPMSRREQLGLGQTGLWTRLLEEPVTDWLGMVAEERAPAGSWRDLAERGGYPTPAVEMSRREERRLWFEGYIQTYLERDLRILANVELLSDFRRLMQAACLRLGNLLNQTELARDVAMASSTAQRYLNLLEISFQLVRLPAYAVNRTKRLTKSPKLYWSDTGLALHLAGERVPRGPHLENLVLGDLLAWRDSRLEHVEILYWRTTKGTEVDFVIEGSRGLLPVEVKAARRLRYHDTSSLRIFLEEYADMTTGGLILYDGEEVFWLADRILAAPWWKVI